MSESGEWIRLLALQVEKMKSEFNVMREVIRCYESKIMKSVVKDEPLS